MPGLQASKDAQRFCERYTRTLSKVLYFMLIQVYPVSSLSFDQSRQSDSPNGKITPAVLLLYEAK